MKRTLFFIAIALLVYDNAGAQKLKQLDSLQAELLKSKTDTENYKILIALCDGYSSIQVNRSLDYATQALYKAQNMRWKGGAATAYSRLGITYGILSEPNKALKNFFESLKIWEELDKPKAISGALVNIAIIYHDLTDYSKALKYAYRGLEVANKANSAQTGYNAMSEIGLIYRDQHKHQEALVWLGKVHDIDSAEENTDGLAMDKVNISESYVEMKNYPVAIRYLTDAGRLAKIAENPQTYMKSIAVLGDIHLALAEAGGKDQALNARAALKYYDEFQALALANGDRTSLFATYSTASRAYVVLNDYKNALLSYQKFSALKDTFYAAGNKETIKNLEDKRQIELRDKQLKITALELSNQKRQRNMYIGGLAMLAVIGGLFFRQSSTRRRANTQLQALNAQLDANNVKLTETNHQLDEANRVKARFFGILSHDLRAPIANLTGYLHLQREAPEMMNEQDRTKHQLTIENAANNLLSVMEDLLLWSKGQMTSFKPQIKSVQILQLFDEIKKLVPHDTAVDVIFSDPGLLAMDTDENFMKTIMRNLTANALKALNNRSAGKVEWKAWEENGKKYLSVTDNGPGLTKEQLENLFTESAVTSASTGLGMHIVRDFVQMLGQKIEVKSEVGKGTSFILSNAA